ncbi:MAG: asparaginase [Amylibacter sp.]|nr:asparaginase [Amylibacter sp.]
MGSSVNLVEVWRGTFLECVHRGRAVVCDSRGNVLAEWGDSGSVTLPRSSSKMLQALPLIESGAAARFGLSSQQLALSCASHQGAHIHTDRVNAWLGDLGLNENDLRCGPQEPSALPERNELVLGAKRFDRTHNNCSGKHTGFLTVNKHLGGGPEYVEPDHPVQKAVLAVFEEMCGETVAGYAIDGCSAPNFACSLRGVARAMARMADPKGLGAVREAAAEDLVSAMKTYPDLVAGEGRACTELMNAMDGPTVIKTGAEGVFVGILPDRGLGVALKIEDGATRASESVMAALLVRLGVANFNNPAVQKRLQPKQYNFAGQQVGCIIPAENFFARGALI